ncbi:unnamed protein product [Urochloa humidicola]
MASSQTCTVRSDAGDILKKVARINAELTSQKGSEAVLESLQQLQAVPMTFEALEATKVGRAVNALRKSAPSEQARELAAALYRSWKALADEHFAARKMMAPADAAPTGDTAASADEAPKVDRTIVRSSPIKAKPQSAELKSSITGSRQVTTPKPSIEEAKLETAVVKKQRSIRIVVKKAEKRPAVTQHCTLLQTAVTPDPTPVSKSNSRPSGSNQKSSASTETTSHQGPAVVKRVSPMISVASLTKGKPPAMLPKPSGSGACKRKEAPTMAFDEARLVRAKMRLHEGYKEASTVKEKRKIQIIAAPGKGRPHPSQVRCTAAGGTGKRPPVPSCPRMPRAA